MRADHVVIAAATPPGVAALYFLLAGEVSWSEAIACAPVGVVASVYALVLARTGTVDVQVGARGLTALIRGILAVLPDSWRVARGLLQAVRHRPADMQGVVAHVPFRCGGVGRGDVGRRAAVITAISLAPNGFAVGINPVRDELIVHQLVPDAVGGDPDWPQ